MTHPRRFNPQPAKGTRQRRGGRALLTTLLFGLVGAFMLPASLSSASGFSTITTPGDGWDVTFHPTNQNYAFFAHHRTSLFGCFYRLDPDGAGPIEQGDGCFNDGYTMSLEGTAVGQRSSAWVTSDGNTAYIPGNYGITAGNLPIVKVDISNADPNNWSVTGTVNWSSNMQYYSGSVMVDDVLYALSSTGWLTLDTANSDTAGEVAFFGYGPDEFSTIYEADGKLWAVSSDWHLHCLDPADGEPCDHNGWTNGKSTDQFTTGTPDPQAVVEYRNTDGSFGGFCIAHGTNWSTHACLNADGLLDPNAGQHDAMVNPFEQMQNAMGNQFWDAGNFFGSFYVTRQHQVIIHEPLHPDQDYFCWDYTTQAACANFTPSDDNTTPGRAYTIIQDPWNDNCSWSNADDKKIGVWNISHSGVNGGFATSGGECDLSAVTTTVTLTYDPQGGTGQPGNQTGNASSNVTVSSTAPTRDGYTFVKWNTAADGSGTDYAGGATYTLPNNGTATLYAQWQINTVTLTYDPQGGTGQPGNQTGNASSNVTVSSTAPTRDGYTFQGWNTQADGNGTPYSGGDTYTLPNSGVDTLYAQWTTVITTPETVTLTYNPQGGTGAPADQTGDAQSDVTVSSTVPTRDGYTFQGWNTQADGNGTPYSGGDTYTLPNSGTDTLYAQWQINTVTLTYDPRGGTGEPADQTGDAQSDVTVSSTVPTRDGYTFQGWNTQADGNGTPYSGGDTYTLPNSGTDTLYAQWQINTVTLTYDPRGGTGEPADQTGDAASEVTVSTTVPTRDGYTFQGWNTQADGNGTPYSGGDTYTLPNSGTDTLYAQWQINTVTLTYDPQGGTGEPADQTGDAQSDVTVSSTVPTRDGYTFQGWNTQADGNGTPYSGGDTYTLPNSGTDTLYAQWQINTVTLTYDPRGGTGEPADQTGDAASEVTVSTTVPTRDGYTFTGWNTTAGGSGTDYLGGDTYTLPNSGTDTLYAQWEFNDVSVTLTGDPGSEATVPTTVPTRDGYTFKGWNTAVDGSGTPYSGGDTYTLPGSGTVTLYAQWEINTVTLTYDPQGGTGEPADQTGDAASDVTVSATIPTRDGYTFMGWNTAADGSGGDCVGGDTYTLPNSGTDTLYAQWERVATAEAGAPTPVPVLPALLLMLTSLLLAALGIRRFV